MKKILVLIALVFTTTVFAFAKDDGAPFDYSYSMGGCMIRVCGTIDFWDVGGFPHGRRTITVTDDKGNTISWDEPFSGNQGSGQLNEQYPEVEAQFLESINQIEHEG